MQRPTVGRIVHYYENDAIHGGPLRGPFAAIVTDVHTPVPGDGEETVSLQVMPPAGMYVRCAVRFREVLDPQATETIGHVRLWTWPPRV